MNLPLPEANSESVAEVREWLDRFALCVREVDYSAARPFWHPDIVIFGTYQELVKSLSAWTERQWDNVWPRTAEFQLRSGKHYGHGFTGWRDGGRDSALDEHRFL